MKAIIRDLNPGEAARLSEVEVDPDMPLIDTVGESVEEGLKLLSKVGLNDAFLFVRRYSQLSDGQKYRYRLAKLIESGAQWWVMDEFCATLDRETAKIVACLVGSEMCIRDRPTTEPRSQSASQACNDTSVHHSTDCNGEQTGLSLIHI